MADIRDVHPGDRLFIRTQPRKRPRMLTVQSVDHEAGAFTATNGETITDLSLVEGWDLAGDIFNTPGSTKMNIDDQVARNFTNERLALDIQQIASNVRYLNPEERAARLREAARRLVNTSLTLQAIVTLENGHQVAYMHGNVHHRSTIGGTWAVPMPEATRPHQPGTWYRGEW